MIHSRFRVGELVRHEHFRYRGVVISVDARFAQSDAWYAAMARTQPPRDRPWYHVLVDGGDQVSYVAECNLLLSSNREQVDHPMLGAWFDRFDGLRYHPRARLI